MVRNAQVVPSERNPVFIAILYTCDNDGNDASYIVGEPSVAGFVPGPQIIPSLDTIKPSIPGHLDHPVKYVHKYLESGRQYIASGIEASGKTTNFDRFGD